MIQSPVEHADTRGEYGGCGGRHVSVAAMVCGLRWEVEIGEEEFRAGKERISKSRASCGFVSAVSLQRLSIQENEKFQSIC